MFHDSVRRLCGMCWDQCVISEKAGDGRSQMGCHPPTPVWSPVRGLPPYPGFVVSLSPLVECSVSFVLMVYCWMDIVTTMGRVRMVCGRNQLRGGGGGSG